MDYTLSLPARAYTPDQVAEMLQLSRNTIYDLIDRGEIVAKKIGKVYRISAAAMAFLFTGLDADLYLAQKADEKNLTKINEALALARKSL